MADLIYTGFKRGLGLGHFDLSADPLRCVLLTSGYVPDAGHAVLADVAGSEAAGTGYAAGGAALSGVSWDGSGTAAVLDADDPVWSGATVTARYAAIYAAKTVDGQANPLVCLLDFQEEKGVVGGSFTVGFDAAGVLTLG